MIDIERVDWRWIDNVAIILDVWRLPETLARRNRETAALPVVKHPKYKTPKSKNPVEGSRRIFLDVWVDIGLIFSKDDFRVLTRRSLQHRMFDNANIDIRVEICKKKVKNLNYLL